jgi:diguanylate cyclase (GGDEF)-like protein
MQLDPKATAAVERLQEALRHSIKLMDREYYSMRLVVEAKGIKDYPDQIKQVKLTAEDASLSPDEKMHRAAELVLDDEYYEQKNWIRREVKNSLQAVEELIQTEETKALDGFQSELNLGRAGIILQILAIFFVVWLTASQGINPILHAVDQIKANSPIREKGANEFRYLANAYNNLYAIYRKSIANLNFKASHDELTGAYNRAGYDLLVSSLDMKSTYLMFFDLDNFKVINDTYGHEIGDKVLQKLVQVLKGSFRSDDYICRLGGDEFVVFMVHSDEMQRHLVERKMVNINRELQTPGDGIPPFSVSVGIVHGTQAADAEALLKKGDEAMYQSKKQGKHTFTFYTA